MCYRHVFLVICYYLYSITSQIEGIGMGENSFSDGIGKSSITTPIEFFFIVTISVAPNLLFVGRKPNF